MLAVGCCKLAHELTAVPVSSELGPVAMPSGVLPASYALGFGKSPRYEGIGARYLVVPEHQQYHAPEVLAAMRHHAQLEWELDQVARFVRLWLLQCTADSQLTND